MNKICNIGMNGLKMPIDTLTEPLKCYMPPKAQEALSQHKRYTVLYGGRGSGKSFAIANYLIAESMQSRQRVLCAREMMNTIRDSVHRLLCDRIYVLKLDSFFDIQKDSIVNKLTKTDFLFKGIHSNIAEIKSLQGVTRCWVEEAEKVSRESFDILIPTIREEGSQLFFTFNPENEHSPCYEKFVVNAPEDSAVAFVNFDSNDLFPDVLRREMEYCKITDFDKYEHIWLGKCKGYSEDCIFRGKVKVEEFETPDQQQLYYGADFGFSKDPSCLIRMFIQGPEQGPTLYIDYEAYGHGIEITELQAFFRTVPGVGPDTPNWKIVADSERPDTISYLHNEGFDIEGAEKGKGSVEDGIQFIRGFKEIIIHPRCVHTIEDFENYRWKRDKITDEILPIPKEGSDHAPDAVRYALERYIKRVVSCWDVIFWAFTTISICLDIYTKLQI